MGIIPTPYKYLAYGILLITICSFIWLNGANHVQDKWNASIEKENLAVLKKVVFQEKITTKVLTQYVDRVRMVKEKSQEITKNVPIYVNKKNDADCVINHGFVVLHDTAANQNTVSDTTGIPNDSPASLKLSTILVTVTDNYAIYHETAERLKSLQQWVKEQSELK